MGGTDLVGAAACLLHPRAKLSQLSSGAHCSAAAAAAAPPPALISSVVPLGDTRVQPELEPSLLAKAMLEQLHVRCRWGLSRGPDGTWSYPGDAPDRCSAVLHQGEVKDHEETCPHAVVRCPIPRCGTVMLQRNAGAHMCEAAMKHCEMMLTENVALKEALSSTRSKLKDSHREVKALKEKTIGLEAQLGATEATMLLHDARTEADASVAKLRVVTPFEGVRGPAQPLEGHKPAQPQPQQPPQQQPPSAQQPLQVQPQVQVQPPQQQPPSAQQQPLQVHVQPPQQQPPSAQQQPLQVQVQPPQQQQPSAQQQPLQVQQPQQLAQQPPPQQENSAVHARTNENLSLAQLQSIVQLQSIAHLQSIAQMQPNMPPLKKIKTKVGYGRPVREGSGRGCGAALPVARGPGKEGP